MLTDTYVIDIPIEDYENESIILLIETKYGVEYIKNEIKKRVDKYLKDYEAVIDNNNPFKFFGKSLEDKIDEIDFELNIDNQYFDVLDFLDNDYEEKTFDIFTLEEWILIKKEYSKSKFEKEED